MPTRIIKPGFRPVPDALDLSEITDAIEGLDLSVVVNPALAVENTLPTLSVNVNPADLNALFYFIESEPLQVMDGLFTSLEATHGLWIIPKSVETSYSSFIDAVLSSSGFRISGANLQQLDASGNWVQLTKTTFSPLEDTGAIHEISHRPSTEPVERLYVLKSRPGTLIKRTSFTYFMSGHRIRVLVPHVDDEPEWDRCMLIDESNWATNPDGVHQFSFGRLVGRLYVSSVYSRPLALDHTFPTYYGDIFRFTELGTPYYGEPRDFIA